MTTINIHDGESVGLNTHCFDCHGGTAALELVVRTRFLEQQAKFEVTVFMSDFSSLDKLKRAAAAFNEIMAEPIPAKEDAEAA